MNTSFLSAFPAAPKPDGFPQARPTRSGKPALEASDAEDDIAVDESESAGDSDKLDAFAEMLAAMMSVTTPMAETHVETVEPAAVESVTSTSTGTDVPRDGAGSPLFTSTFTEPAMQASEPAVDSSASLTADAGKSSAATAQAFTESAPANSIIVDDAAAAELADAGVEQIDVSPEQLNSAVERQQPGLDSVSPGIDELTTILDDSSEFVLPVVSVNSTPATEAPIEIESQAVADVSANTATSQVDSQPATESSSRQTSPAPTGAPGAAAVESESRPVGEEVAVPSEQPVIDSTLQMNEQVLAVAEPQVSSVGIAVDAEQPFEQPDVESREREARAESTPRTSATSPRPLTPTNVAAEPAVESVATGSPAAGAQDVVTQLGGEAAGSPQKDLARERPGIDVEALRHAAQVAGEADSMVVAGGVNGATGQAPAAGAVVSFTDAATASAPAHVSQQVLQALAAYEAELPAGGARSFELLLDPPELGRLLVQMSRTAKGVDVRIAAENETVRSILETTGQELQQSLQLSGFDLGQFGGSSSNGSFAGGEEFVFAPSMESFAAAGPSAARSITTTFSRTGAVNVIV